MKIKLLELFGGIGACSKALERLGIDYEIVDYVEIDKYAVASYNAIHNTNFEPQDICKWDKDISVDLIMHGSPCQDFSLAGKQAGGDKDSGTRSSLMYETIRIVEKLKPKYVIWENVKNLLSSKHIHNFNAYLEIMENLGYKNYYQVLNARDYGIPQNRERVFTVSILQTTTNECKYEFPEKDNKECTVINPLKDISGKSWQFEQNVYSENSILRSLKAGGGSGNIPKVIKNYEFPTKQNLELRLKDMLDEVVDEKYYLSDDKIEKIANWKAYQKPFEKVQGNNSVVPTLTARGAGEEHSGMITYCSDLIDTTNLQDDCLNIKNNTIRIRKLTPKECWRLMGFDDEDFEKAEKVNSNTQLYKQAGNSIVVNVLEAILGNLLLCKEDLDFLKMCEDMGI